MQGCIPGGTWVLELLFHHMCKWGPEAVWQSLELFCTNFYVFLAVGPPPAQRKKRKEKEKKKREKSLCKGSLEGSIALPIAVSAELWLRLRFR